MANRPLRFTCGGLHIVGHPEGELCTDGQGPTSPTRCREQRIHTGSSAPRAGKQDARRDRGARPRSATATPAGAHQRRASSGLRPAVFRPRAETNLGHERVRTTVARRKEISSSRHQPGRRVTVTLDASMGFVAGVAHAARAPVSDPEPGGPAPPRTVRGLSADRASRIGAAIRRDHGRGNAAGRIKGRDRHLVHRPCGRSALADERLWRRSGGVDRESGCVARAAVSPARSRQRLPRPPAGRRPRYGPAPAAIDQHDTDRFASRFRPERRARCCRWLPGGPLAATGPAPVSRARHSAAAHRPRPPPHEHAGSGPTAEGGRPQVRTTDPSTWIGPGTTMLDRSAHRHRAPSRCNPERDRVSTGNPDG